MEGNRNIMNNIKALRKEKKLTVDRLAKEMGVSKSTISLWENGKTNPRINQIEKLSDYFGVSKSYVLGYSNSKEEPTKRYVDGLSKVLERLNEIEKKIKQFDEEYSSFKKEYNLFLKEPFKTLENTMILERTTNLKIVSLDNPQKNTTIIKKEYEEILKEMNGRIERYKELYKSEEENAKSYKDLILGKSFVPQDRINPDFEKNNQSQTELSAFLSAVPYCLNYSTTMKVVEYAKMLSEKDENRFNPPTNVNKIKK